MRNAAVRHARERTGRWCAMRRRVKREGIKASRRGARCRSTSREKRGEVVVHDVAARQAGRRARRKRVTLQCARRQKAFCPRTRQEVRSKAGRTGRVRRIREASAVAGRGGTWAGADHAASPSVDSVSSWRAWEGDRRTPAFSAFAALSFSASVALSPRLVASSTRFALSVALSPRLVATCTDKSVDD